MRPFGGCDPAVTLEIGNGKEVEPLEREFRGRIIMIGEEDSQLRELCT